MFNLSPYTSRTQGKYLASKGFTITADSEFDKNTPCWSLSRLLEMLPMGASISKGGKNFETTTNDWIVSYEYQDENDKFHYKQSQHEELIQAIIDMLVELKTNK